MDPQIRERRGRNTFWIDDRIIDQYGPLLERFPFGADALAVYAVLARRAGRDGESWERVRPMARQAATKERTFQRCIRLLELLGLVAVESCYFEGTRLQTSNRYTLLNPPQEPPHVDPDPARWPPPMRPVIFVNKGVNRRDVADARPGSSRGAEASKSREDRARSATARHLDSAARPTSTAVQATRCRLDTTPGVVPTPTPRPADTTPGVALTPREGNTEEGHTRKEGSLREKTNERGPEAPFAIEEVGLSNRQVWTATLGELARRGDIGHAELERWLRPAALIDRDGATLIVGARNAVARDRIVTRFLPFVRDALGATIGVPVAVSVVVAERA